MNSYGSARSKGVDNPAHKLKALLGEVPYSAELYWYLRQRNASTTVNMDLSKFKRTLPLWVDDARETLEWNTVQGNSTGRKNVLIFGMVRSWIEHTALMGLTLAAMGHKVTLAVMPYDHWGRPANKFDLRRQNIYIKETLRPMQPLVDVVSLYDLQGLGKKLPLEVKEQMAAHAYCDTQYTMAIEQVNTDSEIYRMRLDRNIALAEVLCAYLPQLAPHVVITPNGSVMEYGVVYEVARTLNFPVITYEFGEQDQRIWIAQNADVMRQETDAMWAARGGIPLTEEETQRVNNLFASRQSAQLWQTFFRQWQKTPSKGESQIRQDLQLDNRPIAFVATNVLGDSLTLRRDMFTGITDWLKETVRYFSARPAYQLVVRVHPGEKLSWGPSVYDILMDAFPDLPENIHLIKADASINSYDLVGIADVGIVYTTTMGLEMAMGGCPVIVIGQTHYRGKGFTFDPDSWESYFEIAEELLQKSGDKQMTEDQINLAWRYAYRFFFEYALPYPWHLFHFYETYSERPIQRVVMHGDGQRQFGHTFRYLLGEPIDWHNHL